MADYVLSTRVDAQVTGFVSGMTQVTRSARDAESNVSKATKGISNALAGAFAGALSIGALTNFGNEVIKVTAEFEKFSAVLGNTLGSQALADLKLKELQDFAAKTPFGVNELTGAFVKLANSGFKPTGEQMTKLGDLASSTGKSFDQLAEAILDAQSGEFERLKEFGVRAKDAGDKVIFTYKGVQTEVAKASGAIRDYITSLGSAEGVSGSMAKISETLGGKISNLGDNWDQMLLSVGSNTTGVFSKVINILSISLDKITEFNEELEVASRYNVGSTFGDLFDTLFKYSAAGRGVDTPTEKLSQSILNARKEVSAYVSSALSGAKATGDFGKALAGLKSKGDQALKAIKDPGVVKGISDAYQTGVKAIQDARVNFSKVTPDANFGTKGGKKVKTLDSIMKELQSSLLLTSVQFKSTFDDENKSKISAYQSAINSLVKMGYDPASEAVRRLKKEQQDLFGESTKKSADLFFSSTLPQRLASEDAIKLKTKTDKAKGILESAVKDSDALYQQLFSPTFSDKIKKESIMDRLGLTSGEIKVDDIKSQMDSLSKSFDQGGISFDEFSQKYKNLTTELSGAELTQQLTQLASESLAGGLADSFSGIGEAIAQGGDIISAAGDGMKKAFANLLSQLGQQFITMGVAKIAAGLLATPFGGALIAQGAGLVALGAGLSAGGGIVGSGSKSSSGNTQKPTAFANGGIVYGPTLGLMGEYSGASNNPEVIAPLNKLKGLIGDNTPNFEIVQYIQADKLAVMVRNANEKKSRTS